MSRTRGSAVPSIQCQPSTWRWSVPPSNRTQIAEQNLVWAIAIIWLELELHNEG